jgi:hypothetical protein
VATQTTPSLSWNTWFTLLDGNSRSEVKTKQLLAETGVTKSKKARQKAKKADFTKILSKCDLRRPFRQQLSSYKQISIINLVYKHQ